MVDDGGIGGIGFDLPPAGVIGESGGAVAGICDGCYDVGGGAEVVGDGGAGSCVGGGGLAVEGVVTEGGGSDDLIDGVDVVGAGEFSGGVGLDLLGVIGGGASGGPVAVATEGGLLEA